MFVPVDIGLLSIVWVGTFNLNFQCALFENRGSRLIKKAMQQNKQNICFYSNKCNISKSFLTELKPTPWVNTFQFVCVDPGPSRPKLPAWLKVVPTLVIGGEEKAREGNDALNWISEMKIRNSASGPSRTMTAGAVMESGPSGDLEAWNSAEHTSFAKGFGYSFNNVDASVTDTSVGGLSIPGAFSFLNGGASPSQGTPSMADVKQKSKKEQMFDAQMEEYKRQRDMGMPPAAGRI